MAMGDFCELYRRQDYQTYFDAVATCFFIDTAQNLLTYIETIAQCLKTGGLWLNLGPLLWHFNSAPEQRAQGSVHVHSDADDAHKHKQHGRTSSPSTVGEPGSFELSHDEVVALVERCGFHVLQQQQAPAGATGYVQDPESMLQNVYRPSFWVAKKR
ncbi:hypothetical protein LTR08_000129 [Meristemomyces frigidus]|nr:hypothetical protein LTR08_000129 [Meristemomyces frigidus]